MRNLSGLSCVLFGGENLYDDKRERKAYVKNVKESILSISSILSIHPILVKPKTSRTPPQSIGGYFLI